MTGFNGAEAHWSWRDWAHSESCDPAILARWMAGLDTLDIARELGLPEAVVFNRLFHAREDRRRTSEWIDRATGASS